MNSIKRSAFTLIELSVVILIIGILIAGVMTATGLVKKSKIAAAQSLTKSSPIGGIPDNALWLESSLDSSFKETETSSGDPVTVWYDQKNYTNKSSIVPGGNGTGVGPTYSNTINYIHAVKFAGNANNYLKIADASFLNNTDYTIVILEKRQSANAGYFIGDSAVTTANQTLVLGYSADAQVTHSQGSGNSYPAKITAYSGENPRIFTFISDSVQGKKTYINGVLAAQSSDTNKLSGISELAIGKGYTGEIGEIAIFTRALKIDERKATEDYLGKKFATKINRDAIAGGSCVNGTVTSDSCILDCYTSGITGLTSPSVVSNGASGVTGTCGASGYTGTITLSCSNGILTPSGACTIQQCSYNVTGGSPATGLVNPGSGTISCNTVGHYSSSGYSYTCSGGASISGTCACATGYSASSNCASCDSANYYVANAGTCIVGCAVPANSGITATGVAVGNNVTTSCDTSGFSGNITYSCSNTGVLTISSPCPQPLCTGGTISDLTISSVSYKVHTFTAAGSLSCPAPKTGDILIVGGGAGGASSWPGAAGGGGGGGGVIYLTGYSIISGSHSITVGSGGALAVNPAGGGGNNSGKMGGNGGDSSFDSLVGKGGGGGGALYDGAGSSAGASGGSGGGGSWASSGGASTQGSSSGYYGNAGATANNGTCASGGGGGAGSAATGCAGGNGYSVSITGSAVYYGAGGGGGNANGGYNGGAGAVGGTGGGGAGGNSSGSNGTSGTGYGSGGGGGIRISGGAPGTSGAGSAGIVIIRYAN